MDKSLVDEPKRNFIFIATGAVAAFGAAAAARPFFRQMSPAADSPLFQDVSVDISELEEGKSIRFAYDRHTLEIRHRTPAEIKAAQADDRAELIDPQTDQERLRPKPDGTYDSRFLVLFLACSYGFCAVVGEAGRFQGWYCPCCGTNYDTSGRARSFPAPANLGIPDYSWATESSITLPSRPGFKRL